MDQTLWKFKFLSSFHFFFFFAICIKFLLVKILLSAVLKSVNFIVSLFCTIFKYRVIITFLFLTSEHERLFEGHLSVNRSLMKISYQNNIFNNYFNNFSIFLANFNSFGNFKVCSKAPFSGISCHVQATHLTFNESHWLASAWCGFLLRGVFEQTFILVLMLMLMLLLTVIWIALYEKWYFVIFYSNG